MFATIILSLSFMITAGVVCCCRAAGCTDEEMERRKRADEND